MNRPPPIPAARAVSFPPLPPSQQLGGLELRVSPAPRLSSPPASQTLEGAAGTHSLHVTWTTSRRLSGHCAETYLDLHLQLESSFIPLLTTLTLSPPQTSTAHI